MSNLKSKKGKGTYSPTEKPTCGKCSKKHYGDYLKRTDNCFGCGKPGHKVRDFLIVRSQVKVNVQAQASGSNEAPKKNQFYGICSRGEQHTSLYVVTSMLKAFSINVCGLLDPGSTFSFVTPLVAKKFDILNRATTQEYSLGAILFSHRLIQ